MWLLIHSVWVLFKEFSETEQEIYTPDERAKSVRRQRFSGYVNLISNT
jgi:hypothetical protein